MRLCIAGNLLRVCQDNEPGVSMIDWQSGEPNAKFWVTQLLARTMGTVERKALGTANVSGAGSEALFALPYTMLSGSGRADSQPAGERGVLLVNKHPRPLSISLSSQSGSARQRVSQSESQGESQRQQRIARQEVYHGEATCVEAMDGATEPGFAPDVVRQFAPGEPLHIGAFGTCVVTRLVDTLPTLAHETTRAAARAATRAAARERAADESIHDAAHGTARPSGGSSVRVHLSTASTGASDSVISIEVDVMPFLGRTTEGGPHDAAFKALSHLGADLVRFAPWFPNPRVVVTELEPPDCAAGNRTSWNATLLDQIYADFAAAVGTHTVSMQVRI